ncbi:NAD(P)H-dependent oxidoreductase [Flavobacterium salilacus subsp. salilacus]|uniref:NAD(P)H-dependent oxidoreductase n=1 Tax=Flavobacterium TaxID=237 RepID=UPI001074AF77|nr:MULTISPECIES: NAD(P)H-dependent oxidoreductase [Flavobacterium]KAF2519106.1 NAD(P)H-dependent oxidoreductase [Flavobacterium salilacus subsp. salilacus]MBE1613284.1 NAD(P)H-dependent oxidoreductase [Flavobacterium sp. SaA2.13]
MNNYIENLNWRYATKKYDPDKKVSEEDLKTLKEAVRLSVSSMGLQPYRVLVITDPEVRQKLKPAAYNQNGITDASHIFVFANEVNVGKKHIDDYVDNIITTRGITKENIAPFISSMENFVGTLNDTDKKFWTAKQAYLAMNSLIIAAAVLKIDATPMEGFDKAEFNKILGLDEMGLNAAVVATVGYRHKEDAFQHMKKVRKTENELFVTI